MVNVRELMARGAAETTFSGVGLWDVFKDNRRWIGSVVADMGRPPFVAGEGEPWVFAPGTFVFAHGVVVDMSEEMLREEAEMQERETPLGPPTRGGKGIDEETVRLMEMRVLLTAIEVLARRLEEYAEKAHDPVLEGWALDVEMEAGEFGGVADDALAKSAILQGSGCAGQA
jgi:hypothetical protein